MHADVAKDILVDKSWWPGSGYQIDAELTNIGNTAFTAALFIVPDLEPQLSPFSYRAAWDDTEKVYWVLRRGSQESVDYDNTILTPAGGGAMLKDRSSLPSRHMGAMIPEVKPKFGTPKKADSNGSATEDLRDTSASVDSPLSIVGEGSEMEKCSTLPPAPLHPFDTLKGKSSHKFPELKHTEHDRWRLEVTLHLEGQASKANEKGKTRLTTLIGNLGLDAAGADNNHKVQQPLTAEEVDCILIDSRRRRISNEPEDIQTAAPEQLVSDQLPSHGDGGTLEDPEAETPDEHSYTPSEIAEEAKAAGVCHHRNLLGLGADSKNETLPQTSAWAFFVEKRKFYQGRQHIEPHSRSAILKTQAWKKVDPFLLKADSNLTNAIDSGALHGTRAERALTGRVDVVHTLEGWWRWDEYGMDDVAPLVPDQITPGNVVCCNLWNGTQPWLHPLIPYDMRQEDETSEPGSTGPCEGYRPPGRSPLVMMASIDGEQSGLDDFIEGNAEHEITHRVMSLGTDAYQGEWQALGKDTKMVGDPVDSDKLHGEEGGDHSTDNAQQSSRVWSTSTASTEAHNPVFDDSKSIHSSATSNSGSNSTEKDGEMSIEDIVSVESVSEDDFQSDSGDDVTSEADAYEEDIHPGDLDDLHDLQNLTLDTIVSWQHPGLISCVTERSASDDDINSDGLGSHVALQDFYDRSHEDIVPAISHRDETDVEGISGSSEDEDMIDMDPPSTPLRHLIRPGAPTPGRARRAYLDMELNLSPSPVKLSRARVNPIESQVFEGFEDWELDEPRKNPFAIDEDPFVDAASPPSVLITAQKDEASSEYALMIPLMAADGEEFPADDVDGASVAGDMPSPTLASQADHDQLLGDVDTYNTKGIEEVQGDIQDKNSPISYEATEAADTMPEDEDDLSNPDTPILDKGKGKERDTDCPALPSPDPIDGVVKSPQPPVDPPPFADTKFAWPICTDEYIDRLDLMTDDKKIGEDSEAEEERLALKQKKKQKKEEARTERKRARQVRRDQQQREQREATIYLKWEGIKTRDFAQEHLEHIQTLVQLEYLQKPLMERTSLYTIALCKELREILEDARLADEEIHDTSARQVVCSIFSNLWDRAHTTIPATVSNNTNGEITYQYPKAVEVCNMLADYMNTSKNVTTGKLIASAETPAPEPIEHQTEQKASSLSQKPRTTTNEAAKQPELDSETQSFLANPPLHYVVAAGAVAATRIGVNLGVRASLFGPRLGWKMSKKTIGLGVKGVGFGFGVGRRLVPGVLTPGA